ncbi:MAG: AAA family ATPase [Kiritimatiellae bacterium]|nr:AAA family ATPase [Kiritimatiellia bacterium]
MRDLAYAFLTDAGRIINSGQSRSLILTGNITDLFYSSSEESGEYVPLVELLVNRWSVKGSLLVIYELNGPIRFLDKADARKMKDAWGKLHKDENQRAIDLALARTRKRIAELKQDPLYSFDECLKKAKGSPTYALELLRQMCLCSRLSRDGVPFLWEDLVIIIEGADFLIPEGEIGRLSDVDRQRVGICRDWFADPGFVNGRDTVVLLAESMSLLNSKITRMPQVLDVEVTAPDQEHRVHLIRWFNRQLPAEKKLKLWDSQETLARMTAGLSSHALLQLLRHAAHADARLTPADVIAKVEVYIQDQLGEDVVEFKKPEHTLEDVVGFRNLKQFMKREFIPRIRSTGKSALPGAVVGGPIGAGKSFLLEAVAGELGVVVLVLRNIRSKWFGGTDVLFERLRRIIRALDKSLIFVDEADTQFGPVAEGTHATERRLTGKIQAMMSDTALRGRTSWLLITARIHLLSPDIRRPGRAGSLVLPVLDPHGEDRDDFIAWMIRPVFKKDESCASVKEAVRRLAPRVEGYYAAAFAELRSDLVAAAELRKSGGLTAAEIEVVVEDHIPPAVEATRRYQELQALVNCTRLSLLPGATKRTEIEAKRNEWRRQILALEAEGVR